MVEMDPGTVGYHEKLVWTPVNTYWCFRKQSLSSVKAWGISSASRVSRSNTQHQPRLSSGCSGCSQASAGAPPFPAPSLPAPSCAHGCRFCRANREELCMHSGSLDTDSPRDFWRASACSWSSIRLACCRSASLSSAVCLLGNRQEGTRMSEKNECWVCFG